MLSKVKSFSRLFSSSLISFFSLVILSLLIPKYMGVASFGIWRRASLLLIPAGIVHVGLADGLFNRWVHNKNYRIPLLGYLKSIAAIAFLSLVYVSAAYFLGYFKLDVFIVVASSVFSYGIYSIVASYIQSHSESNLYPFYFVMQPIILLSMTVLSICVLRENLEPKHLFLVYFISFIIPVLVLSSKIIGGPGQLNFKELLFDGEQGAGVMIANICLLISMNIDKLILGMFVGGSAFGSYSLLSALPYAASTIGYPIGLAIYARGTDRIVVKYVGVFSAVLGAFVFYYTFQHFETVIKNYYKSFDFSLLPIFLAASTCVFVMSMAYFPVRRYEAPRTFAIECVCVGVSIAVTILALRKFFGDVPIICISVFGSIFFLWLIYIELIDARLKKRALVDKYE